MCGLIGFSGTDEPNFLKLQLLIAYNEERGRHGAGIYTNKIYDDGKMKLLKITGNPKQSLMTKIKEDKLLEADIVIAHTRQASGQYDKANQNDPDNLHPFNYLEHVIAHNGNITNYEKLLKEKTEDFVEEKLKAAFNTDSKYLAYAIAKEGLKETIAEVEGSFAIIDYNIRTKELKFVRNEERPLFYAKTDEGIYISSIKESLEAIRCKKIKDTVVGLVYTAKEGKIIKTERAKIKEVTKFKSYVNNVHYY